MSDQPTTPEEVQAPKKPSGSPTGNPPLRFGEEMPTKCKCGWSVEGKCDVCNTAKGETK